MTVPKDRYWAKVLFKEFIRHYRKLSDQQIVEDVRQSMDDLDDLNDNGDSFGSKMVRWSIERSNGSAAEASRENGKKGGRPTNESKAQAANVISFGKSGPMPTEYRAVMDFALENNLDEAFVRECWEATRERGWRDADGRPIKDWKGFVFKWVGTRVENFGKQGEA